MKSSPLKYHRERSNLTQSELAEKAGISLRTIQRIEAGNEPKGHTLRSLAAALELDEAILRNNPCCDTGEEGREVSKLRLLNTLAYTFLLIPYGNVLFPLLYWRKNQASAVVNQEGVKIINFQIFWTLATSLLLIICPYLQRSLSLSFSLILWTFVFACCINLLLLIGTSLFLNRHNSIPNIAPIRFL